jgi:hypothetical protein
VKANQVFLPTELREALIKNGNTNIARVYDALFLAGLRPGDTLTVSQIAKICEPYGLSTWTIYRATADDRYFLHFCHPSNIKASDLPDKNAKNKKGRKAKRYQLISISELEALAGVDPEMYRHYDRMPAEKIADVKLYRAEVYASLPRRIPGAYSRRFLSDRLGVKPRTAQRYDRLAGLKVTPRVKLEEMTPKAIEELPEDVDRKDKKGAWLQDENGVKYPPSQMGVKRASERKAQRLYFARQQTNLYGPKEEG